MSDEELRALARAADESDDAASWLRLAQAALRAGAADEAGRAAHRARVKSGAQHSVAIGEVLDGLAPDSLDAFTMRELGARFELGKLGFAAWSPDARTVYAIEGKKAVLAIDVATGARKTIAVLPGDATAFASDLLGVRLAVGLITPEQRKLVNGVATFDLATEKLEPVGRGHQWIHDVAVTKDAILCSENGRLRGYMLDAREKSFLSLKGTSSLHASGAFAITLGTELALHDPARVEARIKIALDGTPAEIAGLKLACCLDRLVVVGADLLLVAGDGAPIARAPLPAGAIYSIAAAPGGRHVAIFFAAGGQRTTRLDLVDVRAGKSRTFELPARPREAAWSLSGRRLAIPTDQGVVVLVEAATAAAPVAPAPAAAPSAKATPGAGWVELRSASRFWRGRREGALIEFHHGALGARGTRGATPCLDEAEAIRELERRIAEKERDGYKRV